MAWIWKRLDAKFPAQKIEPAQIGTQRLHRARGALVARLRTHSPEVFLNVPYDKKSERLFLAFIAGTSALALTPRDTLITVALAGSIRGPIEGTKLVSFKL
jgi:hypothetical protein